MKPPRRPILFICGAIGAVIVVLATIGATYLRVTAAPVRKFSYDLQLLPRSLGEAMPTDARMRRMVRRAQLDYSVNPVAPVGRTVLCLNEIRTDGRMYDIVFAPVGILDIFVIYRFSADGHMLWKIAMS